MTAKITEEMRQAVAHGEPVFVEDPQTRTSYVLVPKSDYDRLQAFIGLDQPTVAETYDMQNAVAHSAGWDDPIMNDYNDCDQQEGGN